MKSSLLKQLSVPRNRARSPGLLIQPKRNIRLLQSIRPEEIFGPIRPIAILATSLSVWVFSLAVPSVADERAPKADVNLPWVTPEVRAPRIEYGLFDSAAVGTKVSYHIYKPLAYDEKPEERFPVLYWLHGTAGGVNGVLPVARHFHLAMGNGEIPPMMVVFVNGLPRRLWCNSKNGTAPVETVFIEELIPHIDATFRTIAARESRIIEGFSMGGYGAARLGFKYADQFAGISILAGGPLDLAFEGPRATDNPQERERILRDVCSDDMEYFKAQSPWTIAETNAGRLREHKACVRQVVGDRDFSIALNRKFDEHLTHLEIDHEFTVLPGVTHDTKAVLDALGKKSGEFYRAALAAKPADQKGRSNKTDEQVDAPEVPADRQVKPAAPAPPAATR